MFKHIVFLLLCWPLTTFGQSAYPGLYANKLAHSEAITPAARPFSLHDVRLFKSRLRDNLERDSAWMVALSADRLLHSFRTTAGVDAGREGGYMTVKKLGGWESLDCELRGHTTGHYLSACALMYAATGEELFRLKGDSLVQGLQIVQQAHGNGYLSAYPEELIDRNLRGQRVWAPWYTLHKILAGLLDQYLYADNQTALEIAKGMGGWAYEKLRQTDEATRKRMLRNEFGGISEAWWNLYGLSNDDRFRFLAEFFYHNDVLDPLTRQEAETFGTKHTNTFIPKVLGEARRYELTNHEPGAQTARFFFQAMTSGHLYVTGSLSDKEHFFDPAHHSAHITGYSGESCCTYNMLKLAHHLFTWDASPVMADYYERALYNHILGQQDPSSGMVSYFLPLRSGTHRVYSTPEHSFWCCVGSGFESHAKYGEAIYYHRADELFVNLFIPSEVHWREQAMKVRLESDFPHSELVRLTLTPEKPTRATIRLRYPAWSGRPEITINGRKVSHKGQAGSYIALTRTWRAGDRIEVRYPMSLRIETTPDDPQRGAILYGPIVLATRVGTEGMIDPAPHSDPSLYNDYYTYDYHIPASICDSLTIAPGELLPSVQRSSSALSFTLPDGRILEPLYDIHRERYIVYWHFPNPANR